MWPLTLQCQIVVFTTVILVLTFADFEADVVPIWIESVYCQFFGDCDLPMVLTGGGGKFEAILSESCCVC